MLYFSWFYFNMGTYIDHLLDDVFPTWKSIPSLPNWVKNPKGRGKGKMVNEHQEDKLCHLFWRLYGNFGDNIQWRLKQWRRWRVGKSWRRWWRWRVANDVEFHISQCIAMPCRCKKGACFFWLLNIVVSFSHSPFQMMFSSPASEVEPLHFRSWTSLTSNRPEDPTRLELMGVVGGWFHGIAVPWHEMTSDFLISFISLQWNYLVQENPRDLSFFIRDDGGNSPNCFGVPPFLTGAFPEDWGTTSSSWNFVYWIVVHAFTSKIKPIPRIWRVSWRVSKQSCPDYTIALTALTKGRRRRKRREKELRPLMFVSIDVRHQRFHSFSGRLFRWGSSFPSLLLSFPQLCCISSCEPTSPFFNATALEVWKWSSTSSFGCGLPTGNEK